MLAHKWPIVLLAVWVVLLAGPTSAQTPTVSGEFSVEPATLLSLGFDWRISGDDNRNAHVDVTFRKKGETAWRTGLPLLRLQREVIDVSFLARIPHPICREARSTTSCRTCSRGASSTSSPIPTTSVDSRWPIPMA